MISMSRIEKKTESEMTEDSMAETTADTGERVDEEAKLDPRSLAKSVVLAVADEPDEVGEFAQSIDLGDHVTDFRFVCLRKGYEGWQWAVTLYHDVELDSWSVNESTLVPTGDSLLAPAWVPWKDRLEAADLSVTDSLGTDPDDPRMEDGFRRTGSVEKNSVENGETANAGFRASGLNSGDAHANPDDAEAADASSVHGERVGKADEKAEPNASDNTQHDGETTADDGKGPQDATNADVDIDPETGLSRELEDTVEAFGLSRRHVMSELGRSQTAKRWYEGQHGPKSLSTKTAEGNLCSTCAFFIGLKGDLNTMFGVCANRWSPDDGRVVSLDHGCGEHSEIAQPEPSHLWVQSKPAFDDLHIDIIAQAPREERGQVELIESIDGDEDTADTESEESDETDDETTLDDASETDIVEHTVPGSLDDDEDDDNAGNETIGKGTVGSAITADVAVESTIDLSDDDESGDSLDADCEDESVDGNRDEDAGDTGSDDSDASDNGSVGSVGSIGSIDSGDSGKTGSDGEEADESQDAQSPEDQSNESDVRKVNDSEEEDDGASAGNGESATDDTAGDIALETDDTSNGEKMDDNA